VQLFLDKKVGLALLQVCDNGPGVPPDDVAHIFNRFYRGTNSASKNGASAGGAGLGLAIAQEIAQIYKGTLTVSSEPGRSTTFTAAIPCEPVIRVNQVADVAN
jgi:signal transduction histidine kinase